MMKVNDAYKNWVENKCEETYEDLGKALLPYVRLETQHLFRTKANKAEREDIASDALINIFSNLQQFKGESSFATWATTLIFNTGMRNFRTLGKQLAVFSHGLIGNESHNPGPSLIDKISLKQLVAKLDKEDQYLVQLQLEGLNDGEIAEKLDICYNTAKKRRERIQEKLRTLYGGV